MNKIILETDITLDVDDVGAMAVLHALADEGEVDILAIMYNEVHKSGTKSIFAINQWYGRPNVPIGYFVGELKNPDSSRYLDEVGRLAKDPPMAKSALELYQEILSANEDQSITIISIGFLNNLAELLKKSESLIAKKVLRLIVMAGRYRDSFNLHRHDLGTTAAYVIENWPTKLVLTDYGVEATTGAKLAATSIENPVRLAYYLQFRERFQDKASWDQAAVLYAIRGDRYFTESFHGEARLKNGYAWELKEGWRTHVRPHKSDAYMKELIDGLMVQQPRAQK